MEHRVDLLPEVRCPVLAAQGRDDEYGTLLQIERITAAAPNAEALILDACGHAIHRDQPVKLTRATVEFLNRHPRGAGRA